MENIWELIGKAVLALGGVGVIAWAIINYFSKIVSDKHIAKFENDLGFQLDKRKRYSAEQFKSYQKLWTSLQNLKEKGDELWAIANDDNLYAFSEQLRLTKNKVEDFSIFIELETYNELKEIFLFFGDYKVGKENLIEIRNGDYLYEYHVEDMIKNNLDKKEKYTMLLNDVRDEIRKQLQGVA